MNLMYCSYSCDVTQHHYHFKRSSHVTQFSSHRLLLLLIFFSFSLSLYSHLIHLLAFRYHKQMMTIKANLALLFSPVMFEKQLYTQNHKHHPLSSSLSLCCHGYRWHHSSFPEALERREMPFWDDWHWNKLHIWWVSIVHNNTHPLSSSVFSAHLCERSICFQVPRWWNSGKYEFAVIVSVQERLIEQSRDVWMFSCKSWDVVSLVCGEEQKTVRQSEVESYDIIFDLFIIIIIFNKLQQKG